MKFNSLTVALLVANSSALKHKSKFLGLAEETIQSIKENVSVPAEITTILNRQDNTAALDGSELSVVQKDAAQQEKKQVEQKQEAIKEEKNVKEQEGKQVKEEAADEKQKKEKEQLLAAQQTNAPEKPKGAPTALSKADEKVQNAIVAKVAAAKEENKKAIQEAQ